MLLIKLFIIIFIIFFIINKFILKKKSTEHFLTWFLPYYDPNLNNLSNFYNNNNNNLNYFKKKFIYEAVKFRCINLDKIFIKKLISYYISNSFLNNIEIKIDDDINKNVIDLIDNKIDFLLSDYSTIIYIDNILKKNIKNIKLVTNLYRLYFYFFTKKKYRVFSLNEIPPSFTIGIIKYPDVLNKFFDKLMTDLGYNVKTDFKVREYNNLDDMFNGFLNSECNMMIFVDIFPSIKINNFLDNNIFDDIILIPFNITDEDLFFKRNKHINTDFIDLNRLSTSYLPKNFGNYIYNINKPDFKINYTNKILITNIYTKNNYNYDFIKFYVDNYKFINDNIDDIGFKLYKTDLSNPIDILDYHSGVLHYLRDNGYITTNNNPNCSYLVGTMKCTDKNLEDNNLLNL